MRAAPFFIWGVCRKDFGHEFFRGIDFLGKRFHAEFAKWFAKIAKKRIFREEILDTNFHEWYEFFRVGSRSTQRSHGEKINRIFKRWIPACAGMTFLLRKCFHIG
jgi:hypothetical protein